MDYRDKSYLVPVPPSQVLVGVVVLLIMNKRGNNDNNLPDIHLKDLNEHLLGDPSVQH